MRNIWAWWRNSAKFHRKCCNRSRHRKLSQRRPRPNPSRFSTIRETTRGITTNNTISKTTRLRCRRHLNRRLLGIGNSSEFAWFIHHTSCIFNKHKLCSFQSPFGSTADASSDGPISAAPCRTTVAERTTATSHATRSEVSLIEY